ncbi:hypothetical protein fHeYen902_065c [Yersinia phage fHe-Yen9-02]|nr:hypothetical protein fHeYen902_065c [Yersinia phage fHe-Yen9-02]
MITAEQICEFLNRQSVERPAFLTSVLRTFWLLDFGDIPDDIDVFQTSAGCPVADILGLLNGMLHESKQRIIAVNIKDTVQFIVENKNEEMSPTKDS